MSYDFPMHVHTTAETALWHKFCGNALAVSPPGQHYIHLLMDDSGTHYHTTSVSLSHSCTQLTVHKTLL